MEQSKFNQKQVDKLIKKFDEHFVEGEQ